MHTRRAVNIIPTDYNKSFPGTRDGDVNLMSVGDYTERLAEPRALPVYTH